MSICEIGENELPRNEEKKRKERAEKEQKKSALRHFVAAILNTPT